MTLKPLTNPHPWNLTPKEAIAVQKHLAGKVIRKSGIDAEDVAAVAGVDTHFHQGLAIAAVVVIRLSDLATVDHATAARKISFPYIQISDFSFVFTPRKPAFTRLGAISQNNLTQLSAK